MALETDAELMLRVKAGDEASFDILLEKYRTPVVKFIQRMVQNSAAAEELAQHANGQQEAGFGSDPARAVGRRGRAPDAFAGLFNTRV